MSITKETRRDSYIEVLPKTNDRKALIIYLLKRRVMTAHELTEELLSLGLIPYYDRNFVSPRLTELKEAGKIQVVGKKYCKRTDRQVAIWAIEEGENA